jgi:hypothetical protein
MEEKEVLAKAEEKPKSSRLYFGKVAIVGSSGTGKSYMTKTADKSTTGFVHVENKPLPYKTEGFKFEGRPKTWAGFMKNLTDYSTNQAVKNIIIDSQTMAFQMLHTEMQNNFQNWDIPKNYNKEVNRYLTLLKGIEKDVIVISHDEVLKLGEGKQKRMVVHNKEFEGKIEQYYTIVLYTGTRLVEGRPTYFLRTFEEDTSTKTPEGLFPVKENSEDNMTEIPNSADFIFNALEKYYTR